MTQREETSSWDVPDVSQITSAHLSVGPVSGDVKTLLHLPLLLLLLLCVLLLLRHRLLLLATDKCKSTNKSWLSLS